ncbi:S-adenosylmethionine:tRNA ribosyltransferase-isomerase, QueA [Syntrophomonas zehnderi OL-4]|uniref:S-adenosylmethionine:tRNA ribosyltransferase-isomerase n=1 Tax=Syntrophomonas zehnderi OL-4 TaxID=690567 RepID=A0A0E4GD03_9FIRM|nr:tRNA preQ1(34) S-adenosylmethionine ribosyltransferase-isomerase QueA [Syntrophomonas zehnderi]CFX94591.1 S-adenosylmethionine:tRNA ribosyltransferase-isomerase, QueA [Syntrophomonas zehnderi OL-4]
MKDLNPYLLQSYQFDLPPHLIAQFPAEPRDEARLLVMDRQTGEFEDRIFKDIIEYLEPGDTLVLNNTRVIPARLFARKKTGARIEILLLNQENGHWKALVKPARRMPLGTRVFFETSPQVEAEVVAELEDGARLLTFHNCPNEMEFINGVGQMPLPPYINRPAEEDDKIRYQTVYAQSAGSAAAPTAGLHFTEELLERIAAQGINIAPVLLHVGLGTFRPVSSKDIRNHQMHYEYYQIDAKTAYLLNNTKQNGKNIIAVGTTVVRTLETVYNENHGFTAQSGETNRFIYPGYRYRAVDKIITNFHLPGSSLIMLVAAFAGLDNTLKAYRHAVEKEYRFFSYGDAMLVSK